MRSSRILIVDDSRDNADSMAMLLGLDGHETWTANDGNEAVARATELAPDIMLLDIGLPGMSGYEVCQAVRKLPTGSGILIIALSGWGQAADKQRALDSGFDEHLTKPVEHGELVRIMETLTRSRASQAG